MGIRLDGGAPPVFGYNLDGICTCPAQESCAPRMAGDTHCDDEGGIDDGTVKIFNFFAGLTQGLFNQDTYNNNISVKGGNGLVFRIRHYNGGLNDKQVELAVFVSDGTVITTDGGSHPPPKWDGNDVWSLDVGSVFNAVGDGGVAAIPTYADTNAYVTNGVLVASAADPVLHPTSTLDVPFRLTPDPATGSALGNITLALQGTIITATIASEPATGLYQLTDGIFAGRYPTSALVETLGTFPDPQTGGHLCPGTPTFSNIQPQICRGADIFRSPLPMDPAGRCDALSTSVSFTAFPAKMGSTFFRNPDPAYCGDASTDCP